MTERRWSDADRELVARTWMPIPGWGPTPREYERAAAVLDALTAAGWVRMDPAEPHLIEFRADGWTIQHPVRCRPSLFACRVNRVAGEQIDGPPMSGLGVYECDMDADGEFVIASRAEGGTDE